MPRGVKAKLVVSDSKTAQVRLDEIGARLSRLDEERNSLKRERKEIEAAKDVYDAKERAAVMSAIFGKLSADQAEALIGRLQGMSQSELAGLIPAKAE